MRKQAITLLFIVSMVTLNGGFQNNTAAAKPRGNVKPIINENIIIPPDPTNDDITCNPEQNKPATYRHRDDLTKNTDPSSLSSKELNWYFTPKNDGSPSGPPKEGADILLKYDGYFLGDTSKKIIYLTFDEGYENGYTGKILDVLKANNVPAAFFVTTPYIKSETELIKRMVKEGHLVCNHSTHHPSMASVKDKSKFENEILVCQNTFEELTGTKMPRFFRPPMGKYSELSLYYTKQLGYKTIFWSFAYADWNKERQPNEEKAKKLIMKRSHSGGIFLLHAVSKTNADILDSLIKEWKSNGFEFKSLNELPK